MDFTDLDAWKVGMKLVEEVYTITGEFPREEEYVMKQQMRKCASSILANIAEGFGRTGAGDKAYKYTISRGECDELRAFFYMSIKLKRTTPERAKNALTLVRKVAKLVTGLIKTFSPSSYPNQLPQSLTPS